MQLRLCMRVMQEELQHAPPCRMDAAPKTHACDPCPPLQHVMHPVHRIIMLQKSGTLAAHRFGVRAAAAWVHKQAHCECDLGKHGTCCDWYNSPHDAGASSRSLLSRFTFFRGVHALTVHHLHVVRQCSSTQQQYAMCTAVQPGPAANPCSCLLLPFHLHATLLAAACSEKQLCSTPASLPHHLPYSQVPDHLLPT